MEKEPLETSKLQSFLRSTSRNHLVFSVRPLTDIVYTDAGQLIAKYISENGHQRLHIESLLPIRYSEQYGSYIALTNIGILFEKQLKIDLKYLFNSLSINNALLICDSGTVENDLFYFHSPNSDYRVNLTGISHIAI